MPSTDRLVVNKLSCGVDNKMLLRGIDLLANCGEITTVIGPNGAGKSTLLKAIAGDIACSAAQMDFCNQDLRAWKVEQRACALAVLSQENSLEFPFSCEEVVAMGRLPHSSGRKKDRQVVMAAMAKMDITHLEKRLYTQLSGGEKQRTQLARVFSQLWTEEQSEHKPRLLLLDEPTAYLDLGHQQQLMRAIRAFAETKVAVLMVLHDVNLAAQYSDKVLVLNEGECMASGETAEVLSKALLSELFAAELSTLQHPESKRPLVFI